MKDDDWVWLRWLVALLLAVWFAWGAAWVLHYA